MKCPHCKEEIIDYIGRCLSCIFCLDSCNSYYCSNKDRMEMYRVKYNNHAPNADFSAEYDGSNCNYYEEES